MDGEIYLTEKIIGAAIKIHNTLGPGLYENVYHTCLCHELTSMGMFVEKEKRIALIYDNIEFNCAYKADIVVNDQLVVEIKAVDRFGPNHLSQILTYLRLGNFKTGLLLNFNEALLKNGIRRVINEKAGRDT